MSNRNIHQIADFSHLKSIVSENFTVIIGFICPDSPKSEKIMVKKFLKRKSELFPLIQFVYMELTKKQIKNTKLDIIDQDYDSYPMIYHIRDGNKVLCEVKSAEHDTIYESFDHVAQYYKAEMEEFSRTVENKTKSNSKSKKQKKAKKSKVVINMGQSENEEDSESEIEIEKQDDEMEENESQNQTERKHMDPEMKAAVEREKFYAIEDAYEKVQEKLFDEVKDRIRLEQKEADEEKKKAKKSKSESKSKSKDNNSKKKRNRQPERPQHDQIGSSSKSKNRAPPRRRRR
jgi:chemotaxis protein histidine kinase CheA